MMLTSLVRQTQASSTARFAILMLLAKAVNFHRNAICDSDARGDCLGRPHPDPLPQGPQGEGAKIFTIG
jgi:hypothetical protein